jgi:DNA-binding transcriptional LysR family regulator
MELRQLRYFIAVAERLSYSKAAQHLHITVPPLSRQIRQLEEELDVRLLDRDRRGVALTDAGRVLLREGKNLATQAEQVLECVRLAKAGEAGRVRIGIGFALGERVSRVLIEHSKHFPAAEIQCKDVYSSWQSRSLREGEIDIGFLRPPIESEQLEYEPLFEEGLRIHVSKSSPLAKRKTLRISDLIGEPLLLPKHLASSGLYAKTLDLYRKAGLTPNVSHVETNPLPHGDIQALLVACGKGIFVMPDEIACQPAVGSEVVAVPLDEPEAKIQVLAAWRKCEKSKAVLAFVNSTRRVFKNAERCPLIPRDRSRSLNSGEEAGR